VFVVLGLLVYVGIYRSDRGTGVIPGPLTQSSAP